MKRARSSRSVHRVERRRRVRQFRWGCAIALLVGIAPLLFVYVLIGMAPLWFGFGVAGVVSLLLIPAGGFVGMLARTIREALFYAGLMLGSAIGALLVINLMLHASMSGEMLLSAILLFGGSTCGGCFGGYALAWISGITQFSVPPQSSLYCIKCGYWLPGLRERRCPECGTPFGRQEA